MNNSVVYLPFSDGSSISFDGNAFVIHKRPKNINAIDLEPEFPPCMAEKIWSIHAHEVIKALENAYQKQKEERKTGRTKKIYSR